MLVRASQASQMWSMVKHAVRGSCRSRSLAGPPVKMLPGQGTGWLLLRHPAATSCHGGDTHPNVLGSFIIFDLSLFSLFVLPIQVIVRCSRVMVFSLF